MTVKNPPPFLKTVEERVMWLLENFPETRNSDEYLYILYLRFFEPEMAKYIKYIPFDVFRKVKKMESVTRARRRIQNDYKLFPPTRESVRRKRQKHSKKTLFIP